MDLCFDVSNLFRSSLGGHYATSDFNRIFNVSANFSLDLQARICAGLEQQEKAGGGTAEFIIDDWGAP